MELVDQFADVFSSTPGLIQLLQHEIKTPLGLVVRQQPYHVPETHCQAIQEEVNRMLRDGIIEESTSHWSRPIMVVLRTNCRTHLCNDFQKLNQVSEFNSCPLSQVDKLMECLGRAQFMSTRDLMKGYLQVTLAPEAKAKTTFSTTSGH